MTKKFFLMVAVILSFFGVGLFPSKATDTFCALPTNAEGLYSKQTQGQTSNSARVYQVWCGGIF